MRNSSQNDKSPGTTIRFALKRDDHRLRELFSAAFRNVGWPYRLEEPYGIPCYGTRYKLADTEAILAGGRSEIMVATDQHDQVLGLSVPRVLTKNKVGEIYYLAVDQSARGKGIGRQLMNATLDYFRRLGLSIAVISFDQGNAPAAGLYASCGFTLLRRLEMYVQEVAGFKRTTTSTGRPGSSIEISAGAAVGRPSATLMSGFEALTVSAELARKHDIFFREAERGLDALRVGVVPNAKWLLAKRGQAIAGALAWQVSSAGPVADIQLLLSENTEIGCALLSDCIRDLVASGSHIAYCWLPENNRPGRASLQQVGFDHFHAAIWLSRTL